VIQGIKGVREPEDSPLVEESAPEDRREESSRLVGALGKFTGYDGTLCSKEFSNRSFLSHARFPHVLTVCSQYIGEERGEVFDTKVVYLDAQQRKAYQLTVQKGLLYDAAGDLFDTSCGTEKKIGGEKISCGKAIFVMDPDGAFYASNLSEAGVFQHSSFLAGGMVAVAGAIEVREGRLQTIRCCSGHYRPMPLHLDQAADCLISQGVEDMEIEY
jgi:hypothetical protein